MSGAPRQPHLDALRAFAMILGFFLHAALSLGGSPWIVRDRESLVAFRWIFDGIHGFRMQLFLFISGYFTMMLWRRRGLAATVDQRYQRVFLPCILGVVSIVPLMRLAAAFAGDLATEQDANQPAKKSPIVEAIRSGNQNKLAFHLENGADPNQPDPESCPLSFRFRLLAVCGTPPSHRVTPGLGASMGVACRREICLHQFDIGSLLTRDLSTDCPSRMVGQTTQWTS